MANSTKSSMTPIKSCFHLFIFILLVLTQETYGQYLYTDSIQLTNAIHKLIKKYKTPDCAILVTRNDSITFQFDNNVVNHNKNYYIGSCSKSFTALALLQLVDAGKVALDTPIIKYLPWFRLKDSNQSKKISVRHLLNQTGGFKTEDGFYDFEPSDQSLNERKLATWLQHRELKWAPGTAFNYCNLNYILAGIIISSITHDTYSSFLKKNIFSKIGMTRTYASSQESKSADLVPGYQNIFNLFTYRKRIVYSDLKVPEGYISSNTSDLALYLQCVQDSCKTHNGDRLLSSNSYRLLTTPLKDGYAMGWMGNHIKYIEPFDRKYKLSFIYHTGAVENYNAVLALYPDHKTNIIVLSNINSLEFSLEALKTTLVAMNNDSYVPGSSNEYLLRNIFIIVFIMLTASLLYNIHRWKKYHFKIGVTSQSSALIHLFTGLLLSIAALFIIPQMNNISLNKMADYFPDFAYGSIVLSCIGIINSLIRYQVFYAKKNISQFQRS